MSEEEVIRYGAGGVIYKGGVGKTPEPKPEPTVNVEVEVIETETEAETIEEAKVETKK
tara:strand:+ start:459 stop:632 length:174 start_codon:yes stop_codon:yes gene_type:complete